MDFIAYLINHLRYAAVFVFSDEKTKYSAVIF